MKYYKFFNSILKNKKQNNVDYSWKVYKKDAAEMVHNIVGTIVTNHPELSFEYNRITIRNQKTRWGSCSSKRNLNFNYKIILLPYLLAEYLVVHELCHLVHLNHSKDYWKLVESIIPDHRERRKALRKINLQRL